MPTAEWIRSGLDVVLIVLIGVGLMQATRLIWHLAGLRASRAEMERFVREFNATVGRAEAGIKNLKAAARESGDDLEKLVEKAVMIRDELSFIVESADQLANRLTEAASAASGIGRGQIQAPETRKTTIAAPPEPKIEPEPAKPAPGASPATARREPESKPPSSRAEKELLQALQKLN